MNLKIRVKQLGSRRDKIGEILFPIENEPHTVRELIRECVTTCVTAHNKGINDSGKPLSEQQLTDLSEAGKIAFGISYNNKKADLSKALETAFQGYEDGLFRIFIDEDEAGVLDAEVVLSENNTVTFIKLTMLAGRMW